MPTLIVLRHAKAAAGIGLADFDRPLTERGRTDAAATGDRLRDRGLLPDAVLCSPALRTRQTLEGLALGDGVPVEFEQGIYDNDPAVLADLVRLTGDEARTLLLVGHNPAVHQLVHDLAGDAAPREFPTCAAAVIELGGPWRDLVPGTLTSAWTPKDW
ncbi:SixA phosphatase family protein [Actinomadura macrotermitis]|uniref:Histidine phosphatase family protein n=1 Tax=Actinomadura macrotermitis TaxID=2585200 RepID=A0A7K0BWE0_9ACTN|nr:histidine phosphatase family protein [Actinomadura macrotermitis]MQY05489.1 hypothetical protein [Actinomadura macrotermitis]